jgi:hypothetical protein
MEPTSPPPNNAAAPNPGAPKPSVPAPGALPAVAERHYRVQVHRCFRRVPRQAEPPSAAKTYS